VTVASLLAACAGNPESTASSEASLSGWTPSFDYGHAVDPAAAAAAVDGGAFFSASMEARCSTFLWWLTCKPPTTFTVGATFARAN
jgi:hypothetical protein